MNDCQEKALKEGCHEREQAQMDVSSIEKTNTPKRTQLEQQLSPGAKQSLMDMSVENGEIEFLATIPMSETLFYAHICKK